MTALSPQLHRAGNMRQKTGRMKLVNQHPSLPGSAMEGANEDSSISFLDTGLLSLLAFRFQAYRNQALKHPQPRSTVHTISSVLPNQLLSLISISSFDFIKPSRRFKLKSCRLGPQTERRCLHLAQSTRRDVLTAGKPTDREQLVQNLRKTSMNRPAIPS